MKKGADRIRKIGSMLALLLLFLVLASQVQAQPYVADEPPRKTSVQDIIDNQEEIEQQLKTMSRAMTEMKDSMETQINSVRRSTILFLFALFFFYQASTALWNRILKYRHWQKHVNVKGDLESQMTAKLKEQNELLSENNSLLVKLQNALSTLTPKPEELKLAPALAMASAVEQADTNVTEQKEDGGKKNGPKKNKPKSRVGGILRFFVLIGLLALASAGVHFYLFDEEIVMTAIFTVGLIIVLFWFGVILFFIKYRKARKSKPSTDKPVKISHEISKEGVDKPADSDSKEKVEEKPEEQHPVVEKEVEKRVDQVDQKNEVKPDPIFDDFKTKMEDAAQEQKEMEEAIKEEPVEVKEEPKPSKKLSLLERMGFIRKKKGKEDEVATTPEEVDELYELAEQLSERPQQVANPIMEMGPEQLRDLADRMEDATERPTSLGGEPEEDDDVVEEEIEEQVVEQIKEEIKGTDEQKRVESYLETTIVDLLKGKESKSTTTGYLYRKLDASKEEIMECIENSKEIKRKATRVFLEE